MRTIILTCHHSSGWLKYHIMEDVIKNHDYYHIPSWPVYTPDEIYHWGRFYMLYNSGGRRFIMMKGKFESAARRDLYSREGNPHQRSWVGLDIEQFIHYKRGPILEASLLSKAIPTVDWWGDYQELVLTEEESERMEQVWEKHVERHNADFQNPALVRHFEEEYQKMEIGERARKSIIGVEKLDAIFGEGKMHLHDAVVTQFNYDREKMELNVLVDTYCPAWSPDGKTIYLIPFCFKDVYDFKMDVEPRNDYLREAKIYQDGNSIHTIFEGAHIEVDSQELEIGEVVEIKCGDEETGNKFKF